MEYVKHDLTDGRVILFACAHVGAHNCHYAGIRRMIDDISKKNTYWISLGDNIEGITPFDKRFNWSAIDLKRNIKTPEEQKDEFVKLFKPVAKKCLAIGMGNHELKMSMTTNFPAQIARELNAPYGSIVFKMAFAHKDKVKSKLFLHHGAGQLKSNAKDEVQRWANMASSLKQRLIGTDISDCVGMFYGHVHRQLLIEPTYNWRPQICDRDGKVTHHFRTEHRQDTDWVAPDTRWYGTTGTFRMTYTQPGSGLVDYSEAAMYGAADLGYLVLHYQGGNLVKVEGMRV